MKLRRHFDSVMTMQMFFGRSYVVATLHPGIRGTGDVVAFGINFSREFERRHMERADGNVSAEILTMDVVI